MVDMSIVNRYDPGVQERFNRYYLTEQIASKSCGSAYLAHDVSNGSQKVVLKVFEAACFTFDQQSKTFFQKGEKIKQLRHSSIVPLLDLGVEQGQPYIVREYITRGSLRHWLDSLSPQRLNLQEALTIIIQVGQALSYAHQRHTFHGNIKPENIFFNDHREALLSDFGLANILDVRKLSQKSDLQTVSYIAPEQFVGATTEKSDQYALACLAYELITGRVLFSAQTFSSIISFISIDGASGKAIERKGSGDIDQAVLVQAESFCENSQCPDCGKVGNDNIRKYGKNRRGEQRWQCKTCQMTWSFSSMWTKRHLKLAVSLSDLVPDLPRPIEEVVLKAMAKDPSQRYADISHFLRALETASLLPPSVLTSDPPITPSSNTLVTTLTKPLENRESEVPLVAPPATRFLGRTGHVHNEHNDTRPLVRSARDTYVEDFPAGRRSQPDKPFTPTLWLAFALSGMVLLLGTVILYALVPLRSPGSPHPGKSSLTAEPSVLVAKHPMVPSFSQTPVPTPTVGQPSNLRGGMLNRLGWTASASSPNDLPSNALDGDPSTHWSTGQAQANGEWFLADMGSPQSFSKITLDSGAHGEDYPRGYQVFVSTDGSNWGNAIASGNGSGEFVTISFATQSARFIKVVLIVNAGNWWSIYEFSVYDASGALNRSGWIASASSSNKVPSNALDGDPSTRWSTGQAQANGEWFLVDMGSAHSFSSIILDSGAHDEDYPRGYQVFVSTDGSNWGNAIASGNGSGEFVTISFATQSARFIKVVLTANASNWWSIAEFNVYS